MRETIADLFNFICDCGYETGFTKPKKVIKAIIKAGGNIEGDWTKTELNIYSSICPKCKAKNSFDVECKQMIVKGKDYTISNIETI